MKRGSYLLSPKNLGVLRGVGEAWWYADKGAIEIHVQVPGAEQVVMRLRRAEVKEYLRRMERTTKP